MGLFSWCETGKGMGSMCSLLTALGSQYCHVILGTRAGLPLWNTISPAPGNLGHSVCACSGYVCKYIYRCRAASAGYIYRNACGL